MCRTSIRAFSSYKIYITLISSIFFSSIFFLSSFTINSVHFEDNAKVKIFAPVISKLIEKGVDTNFIKTLINDPRTKFNDKFVKINVTGFLKKPDYSVHYNDRAVRKSVSFLSNNLDILSKCETEYGIPKEVITSILWIETRHGGYTGNNHIPSVFLSTALADQKEYLDMNLKYIQETYEDDSEELRILTKKIIDRAKKKAKWAFEELLALEKIQNVSPIPVTELEGSWAGAFGMSQFLPSSYINWAVDGNGDDRIDLFEVEDAVYSVANYLKINGWGNTTKAKRKAVYHYNHSNEYVDAVLILADKISE